MNLSIWKCALLVIIIAAAACPVSGYAGVEMLTNDDLERKYPKDEEPAWSDAYRLQNQRLQRDEECESLKQLLAQARSAAYNDSDPRNKVEYTKIQQHYLNKCRRSE